MDGKPDRVDTHQALAAAPLAIDPAHRVEYGGDGPAGEVVEYIIFIIDTSGSMYNYAWSRVRQEMIAILDIYPQVKGIQVMSDMGSYMFPSYRGKWIPDSPARRRAVIERLASWTPFSNSSPVEGIERAIRAYYTSDKKISLFVFGDDFTGGAIAPVLAGETGG